MNSASFLPTFFQQCCDAGSYLEIGAKCALHNNCYDETRPGGVGYWFSLPTRLGLPDSALVYTNLTLLLVSSLLSVIALLSLSTQTRKHANTSIVLTTFLVIASFLIHAIFLWPTLFTSLSDPPSTLLMLNGIWLLLLSRNTNTLPNLIFITAGSSMIGLAAWIRSFYFYPLLASVAIFFICFLCLRRERKKIAHALILSALFFPAVQVMHTYKVSGKIAYMYTTASNAWTDIHLNSKEVGYDTVLPLFPMYSLPQNCSISNGLLPSLKERDFSSLFCLLYNRTAFYLGTYKNVTYIDSYYPINKLLSEDIENIGKPTSWLTQNVNIQWDVSQDPLQGNSADKMDVVEDGSGNTAYLVQWVTLPANTEYTFSVWLWAEHPGSIEIAFSHHGTRSVISRKTVSVTKKPQRFFVSGNTLDANDYSVSIGNMPFTGDHAVTPPPPSPFYAWGAQLERGSSMTKYTGIEKPNSELLRPKYPLLLAANILAIFAALLFLVRNRKTLFANPTRLMAVSIVIFSFAQALAIIPEQRFVIAPMIFIWLLACTQFFSCVSTKFCQPPRPS